MLDKLYKQICLLAAAVWAKPTWIYIYRPPLVRGHQAAKDSFRSTIWYRSFDC